MTIADILAAESDDVLYDLITQELDSRWPAQRLPIEPFVSAIQSFPRGLRAMAATYDLDVSLCLDSLGWHFGNWHHVGLAEETAQGLRELGAERMAELFSEAFHAARQYWSELGDPNWIEWLPDSAFNKSISHLNNEAWDIWEKLPRGLFSYWLAYARQHPESLIDAGRK